QLNAAFDLGTDTGVLVEQVVRRGPADQAGIEPGDVIVRIDDRDIETIEDVFAELREHDPSETVEVRVKRGGEDRTVEVRLGELPEG
ncbi:MAG TPA: PDZ domain-containing protein, partial [Gaiellaceae bacterium]